MYLISVLKHTHTCSEREKETGRQTQGQTKDREILNGVIPHGIIMLHLITID